MDRNSPIFPDVFRIRQSIEATRVVDIAGETTSELGKLRLERRIRPDDSVAITAGSRGISNIAEILRATVDHLERLGAKPFIVPAMGSHGGATAEGQRALIARLGITPDSCGCPIRSSMETVIIGEALPGVAAHFDRYAFEADHVLLCGRVKPHTRFVGDFGSGLVKMMLIGLGNHAGAEIYHRAVVDYGFDRIVRATAPEILARCRIAGGLAIVENGHHQTGRIEGVAPEELFERERELLALAWDWMPKLPFPTADVLIVDEIGKEISGSGMDAVVVGRAQPVPGGRPLPRIRRIIVRSLTEATRGNATGIGMADFCHRRVLEQFDPRSTRLNSLTAGHPEQARLPLDYDTDCELLEVALATIGLTPPPQAELMWIRNTLDLQELECSRIYRERVRGRADLEILSEPRRLPLDDLGNLQR